MTFLDNFFINKKIRKGMIQTKPTNLARSLCPHSHKYIILNSDKVIELLTMIYSGIFLYFSNSTIQELSDKGGNIPIKTSHSVIDSPESVILVAPPTKTNINSKTRRLEAQIIRERFVIFFETTNVYLF